MKLNSANVMPVIFASALLTLPATIIAWVSGNQNSFLEIMTTLKEDEADGFALWVDHRHLDIYIDYEYQMKLWSWRGGADGWADFQPVLWMSAVERFLDAQIEAGAAYDQ